MLPNVLRRVPVRLLVLAALSLFLLFRQPSSTAYLPHLEDPRISSYLNNTIGQSRWSPISLDRLSNLASGDTPAAIEACPACPNATTATVTISYPTPEIQLHLPEKQSASTGGSPSTEQQIMNNMRDEGIVIIFKTGAQEVAKLAIHLGTTLRFFDQQDIIFFSDIRDTLGPFAIHNALQNVDHKVRENDPDFGIYRRLHEFHATGRDIMGLVEAQDMGNGRAGWRLDKFKFLHMVEEAFEMRPNAKWYVFIETDSYVFWPNLVAFLKRHDHKKPLYMGSAVLVDDLAFAHGGSGYVLSHAAMTKLLGPEQPQGLAASWDERTVAECCGDIVLAKVLKEQGIELTVAHPWFNGYKPTTFTYGPNNHWCHPVVTMHHMTPADVSDSWRYERQREMIVGTENMTLFADLFHHFVEPHIASGKRDHWDNLSHGPTYSRSDRDAEQVEIAEKQITEQKKKNQEMGRQKHLQDLERNFGPLDRLPEQVKQQLGIVPPIDDEMLESKKEEGADEANFEEGHPETASGASEEFNDEKTEEKKESEGDTTKDETNKEEDMKQEISEPAKDAKTEEEHGQVQKDETDKEEDPKQEFPESTKDAKTEEKEQGHKQENVVNTDEEFQEKQENVLAPELTSQGDQTDNTEQSVKNDAAEAHDAEWAMRNGLLPPKDSELPQDSETSQKHHEEQGEARQEMQQDQSSDNQEAGEPLDNTASNLFDKRTIALKLLDEPPLTSFDKRQEPGEALEDTTSKLFDKGQEPEVQENQFSPIERSAHVSFDHCAKACEANSECFQFVHYDGTCKLGLSIRLGQYHDSGRGGPTWKSGWLVERIRKWSEENACEAPRWEWP